MKTKRRKKYNKKTFNKNNFRKKSYKKKFMKGGTKNLNDVLQDLTKTVLNCIEEKDEDEDGNIIKHFYLKDFDCPISMSKFEDPVIAGDGHTYERTNIEQWLYYKHALNIAKHEANAAGVSAEEWEKREANKMGVDVKVWKQNKAAEWVKAMAAFEDKVVNEAMNGDSELKGGMSGLLRRLLRRNRVNTTGSNMDTTYANEYSTDDEYDFIYSSIKSPFGEEISTMKLIPNHTLKAAMESFDNMMDTLKLANEKMTVEMNKLKPANEKMTEEMNKSRSMRARRLPAPSTAYEGTRTPVTPLYTF